MGRTQLRLETVAFAGRLEPILGGACPIGRGSRSIHRRLGPGLLESVYLAVLAHELRKRGLRVETEVPIPVIWEEVKLEVGFRADLIVEGVVIVELKSIEAIARS